MAFQTPDSLTLRGQTLELLSYPLEPYVRELPDRPDFRLEGLGRQRGYEAAWEVRADHTLWLTGIRTRPPGDGPDPGIRAVFPRGRPMAATWVSYCLQARRTERRFNPIGNGTVFTRKLHLSVWEGRLVILEDVDGETGRRLHGELTPHVEGIFGPEEGAFLRAAFAAPDDAAPRLIYADWLDERNDPRAELVRLAERVRRLDRDAATRERSAHRDLIHHQLGPWPWVRLLGYEDLASGAASAAR